MRKQRKGMTIPTILAMVLLLITLVVPTTVKAYPTENVDPDKDCTLTIESDKLVSTKFYLYKVASMDSQTQFTLTDDFAGSNATVNGLTSSQYTSLAVTLSDYVTENSVKVAQTVTTNSSGSAKFASTMKPGMYLLVCKDAAIGSKTYTVEQIIIVPTYTSKSTSWTYDVTAKVKATSDTVTTTATTTTTTTTTTTNKKLPQTGQLWWPVPVLAAIGIAIFAIGALKNKYYHKNNDK